MRDSVLIVWGGWEGHTPKQSVEVFAPLLEEAGLKVIVEDSLTAFEDAERLKSLALIVPAWTMDKIAPRQLNPLLEAVRAGTPIGGWHGCMGDSFREATEYQFMVGGQWVAHPGNMIDYSVQIGPTPHPITEGLQDFTIHSEQYYMHVDPGVQVLATTTFDGSHASWTEGVVMPVTWTKHYGKGPVFYCSLGHTFEDFKVPEAREMVRRGLLWTTGRYPAEQNA